MQFNRTWEKPRGIFFFYVSLKPLKIHICPFLLYACICLCLCLCLFPVTCHPSWQNRTRHQLPRCPSVIRRRTEPGEGPNWQRRSALFTLRCGVRGSRGFAGSHTSDAKSARPSARRAETSRRRLAHEMSYRRRRAQTTASVWRQWPFDLSFSAAMRTTFVVQPLWLMRRLCSHRRLIALRLKWYPDFSPSAIIRSKFYISHFLFCPTKSPRETGTFQKWPVRFVLSRLNQTQFCPTAQLDHHGLQVEKRQKANIQVCIYCSEIIHESFGPELIMVQASL